MEYPLTQQRLRQVRKCHPDRGINALSSLTPFTPFVRIRSTVLTQPGTLVIFRCFPFPENSRTPTFLISRNSGLRRFLRFSYYVILLVSCLHPSLVTLSAVGNTSLSLDLQFPLALSYCSRLCNSVPPSLYRYNSSPFLSYKYLYPVPRSIRIKITIPLPLV